MGKVGDKSRKTHQAASRDLSVPCLEAVLFGVLAVAVYAFFASRCGNLLRPSSYAYFNHLAKAFLDGHLYLVDIPPSTLDLSVYSGRAYVYWPPFPALVLMPLIAIWGTGVSDVLATVVLGGLNVFLVARLLAALDEEGITELGDIRRRLVVVTFAFGSAHLPLAALGRVWYTAQIIGFAFVCLMFLAALKLRGHAAFLLAGLALACAVMTRNHLVFCGLWPAWLLLRRHLQPGTPPRRFLSLCLGFVLPVACAVGLLAAYNFARFGSVLETGISYHAMDDFFRAEFERFGAFSLHYVPRNLFWQYVKYPFPLNDWSLMGGSLFLLTPVFLGVFWATRKTVSLAPQFALVAGIVLTAIPILMLMGTGWAQFGPRYTLDFTVPLLVLVALGLQRWPVWLTGLAASISVAHYLAGTTYLASRFV